ncbi:MAG: Gfo/Idh/MocA family oxidoreductase [Phycisphaerae bacterium]|nr:Gfo/Idh/MocA family oxidoreductase [Phycisphaerae bacterium]
MSSSRRSFIRQSAFAALSAVPATGAAASMLRSSVAASPRRQAKGANGKLAVAHVGVGGMGKHDLQQVMSHPQVQIVGLCDMNLQTLATAREMVPGAAHFQDWREMYDALGDKVDAIVCSTPDHMHAPISMTALNRDKHVYCQKPLARLVYENRQLAAVAASKPKIVTQMGTQRFAKAERRLGLTLLQLGIVGKAKALYGWTDRPAGWWPSGQPRPAGNDPVPEWLGWNLFLGVSPERPFVKEAYTPFKWRGFYDFGTGAIGDMACHIMDVPYMALQLGAPKSVWCESPDATDDEYPNQESIRMSFAATPMTAGELPFLWFDGGRKPDLASIGLPTDLKLPNNDGAAIVVGETGVLVQPCDSAPPMIFRNGAQVRFDDPGVKTTNHWHDWVDACLGKGMARAPFQVAGRLCEVLSLGAISSRFNKKTLEYDGAKGEITNDSDANGWVRRPYRQGWAVENL